ncbi:aspartic peptidase domain-containing protein [Protomyces lactucae-debilis]|uniref:Aspartic peptidase domain-containing protein n=1 Tax=Protomyces lactucae-debilis TaxID=2754530 RepID=A0A1Y2FSA3_PROLT|nr:aspartic peptidase domain-containing protein [Protomyces lactucae-debilis]ORY86892.1 aspartic peptidase domain-containing protein [Protomyces lactucae-debilis]
MMLLVGILLLSSLVTAKGHAHTGGHTTKVTLKQTEYLAIKVVTGKQELRMALKPPAQIQRNAASQSAVSQTEPGTPSTAYLVNVQIGKDNVDLVIDTGSSDTFCVSKDFKCTDKAGNSIDLSACRFGKSCDSARTRFSPGSAFFSARYGDGENLKGYPFLDDVHVSNVSSIDQVVSLATSGYWTGDSISSGILGLGIGTTSVFAEPNPSDSSARVVYQPFVKKLLLDHKLPKGLFSMAVTRQSTGQTSGALAFGGRPHGVKLFGQSTCVHMVDMNGNPTKEPKQYQIKIDKIKIGNVVVAGSEDQIALIDSGTSLISAPETVATQIAQAWAAGTPSISITIGKVDFMLRAEDLVTMYEGKKTSTFVPMPKTSENQAFIFGDVFLRSVLAVFDVKHSRMMFTSTNEVQHTGQQPLSEAIYTCHHH